MKNSSFFRLSESAVEKLAHCFSTPLLVLSLEQIENNYNFLKKHMPRVKIHYAVKANPDERIIKQLYKLGSYFDVASDGEIKNLHSMGVEGEKMLYANPFKTDAGLTACVNSGVDRFTFDSLSEIDKMAHYSPGAEVLVRVKIDNTEAIVDLNKKFGADREKVMFLVENAKAAGLNVKGICFHVGSQTLSANPYIHALDVAREIFDEAKKLGYDFSVLDIGGGYPVPNMTDEVNVASMLIKINNYLELKFPNTEIWSEPGRFICATAVNMLTRVIGVTERNNTPWYFLDEGVYGTFSGVLFDHWDYEFITFKEGEQHLATFAGPSCDSLDVISVGRMTVPLEMDDIILVPSCGAYSSASATTFNGFKKAETVIWEDVKKEFNLLSYAAAV